jgi:hypothetical protein
MEACMKKGIVFISFVLFAPVFTGENRELAETTQQRLQRLRIIAKRSKKESQSQEFIINKQLPEYLQEYSEKPIISIGTEHLIEEQWNERFHTDYVWEPYDIDYHKMPEDTTTHQKEYVINLQSNNNPDLQGNINNTELQNYLLKHGTGTIYLIWEEHLDHNVMAGQSVRKNFINLVYQLLHEGGYFVFETFEDSQAPKIRELYAPFLDLVKETFGIKNVFEYPFDKNVYRAKKVLLKEGIVSKIPEQPGFWDYSQVPFPVTISVPIVTPRPGKSIQNLKDYPELPDDVKKKVNTGEYKFNDITKEVYKEITVDSVKRLQALDERTRIIAAIDPVLAKYPTQKIIVGQKKSKIEKEVESKSDDDVSEEEVLKKPSRWEKIKQYVTKQNVLKAVVILSLPAIFYLIYKNYRKK